jgi:hypothetical protein
VVQPQNAHAAGEGVGWRHEQDVMEPVRMNCPAVRRWSMAAFAT